MTKERLGTNLNALLGDYNAVSSFAVEPEENSDHQKDYGKLLSVPIEFIKPGKCQPRKDMHSDALEGLAGSIRAQGIIQPIVVRKKDEKYYEIIAGERRWRAAQMAELTEVPVFLKDVSERSAVCIALIENIQREDLNPLEEAIALSRLLKEFNLTQQEVANAVGRSRVAVANLLRLLTLSEQTKKLLEYGDLEMGHARSMVSLSEEDQRMVAKEVISRELSVRQTEHLVRNISKNKGASKKKIDSADPNIKNLEDNLSQTLGSIVKLHYNAKGKGKLVVSYNSLDELDEIIRKIKK